MSDTFKSVPETVASGLDQKFITEYLLHVINKRDAEIARLRQLETMVQAILSQSNDDHCHLDWGVLYPKMAELVGMPDWKPTVLPKDAMLRNCEHFADCLSRKQPYVAPVITAEEATALRDEIKRLKAEPRPVPGLMSVAGSAAHPVFTPTTTVYKCGCEAAGMLVASYCPIHGESPK